MSQAEKWPVTGETPDQVMAEATVEQRYLPEEDRCSKSSRHRPNRERMQRCWPIPVIISWLSDGMIEIQAEETLGHYASWLNIRTQKLRDLNGYDFRKPVVIGRHLQLDFTRVTPEQFSAKRIAYHRELQESFFARYRIADTKVHEFQTRRFAVRAQSAALQGACLASPAI